MIESSSRPTETNTNAMDKSDDATFSYGPDPFPNKVTWLHGNATKATDCRICMQRFGRKTNHRHHSTVWFRQGAERLHGPSINCPSCKTVHPATLSEDRTIILLTSSTLHNVILNDEVRLPFHMDIESVCGVKIPDLFQAWKAGYKEDIKPQDLIIVSGLNDITTTTPEQFSKVLYLWKVALLTRNPRSTIRVCKLMRPPKLCWLAGDGQAPSNFVDYTEKINQINQKITDFNESGGLKNVVGFSLEGIRAGKKRWRNGEPALSHVWGAWREREQGRDSCLHLAETRRVAVMKRLIRYVTTNILD